MWGGGQRGEKKNRGKRGRSPELGNRKVPEFPTYVCKEGLTACRIGEGKGKKGKRVTKKEVERTGYFPPLKVDLGKTELSEGGSFERKV